MSMPPIQYSPLPTPIPSAPRVIQQPIPNRQPNNTPTTWSTNAYSKTSALLGAVMGAIQSIQVAALTKDTKKTLMLAPIMMLGGAIGGYLLGLASAGSYNHFLKKEQASRTFIA